MIPLNGILMVSPLDAANYLRFGSISQMSLYIGTD